jgi:23S rRNA (cytidine2498-2'-O)-methyltransferase
MTNFTVFLSAEGFQAELLSELAYEKIPVVKIIERLVITEPSAYQAAWAQNMWTDASEIVFDSIQNGAKELRSRAPWWTNYPLTNFRRAQLIQAALPKFKNPPLGFPPQSGGLSQRNSPLAAWSLLAPGLILASARCSHPYPHGEVSFVENKVTPPSRAYLKLWELFSVYGFKPGENERVVDMGSSPGGWTWVLQQLGCDVLSVDRADLDAKIAALPRITCVRQNAFSIKPEDIGAVDWFFSDIICEPAKLLQMVRQWQASGLCSRFVCTLKFKGVTDHVTARAFAAIPDSRLVHLFHNKHELTWFCGPDLVKN